MLMLVRAHTEHNIGHVTHEGHLYMLSSCNSLHEESSIRACSLFSLPPSQNATILIQGHVETLETLEDHTCTHRQSVDKAGKWRERDSCLASQSSLP